MHSIPSHFNGVGYTKAKNSLPLESIRVPVPQPSPNQVLIHVYGSSLNPLEYKLALLNFFGRNPPVILGFDLSGLVVAIGANVKNVSVGDEVMAMADLNKDGGWAIGGYAVARDYLTVKKSSSLSFDEAAVSPICFLSAYIGIYPYLNSGDTIYIPGGAGGVGHLAIQMAAHALGASRVISSGSKSDTIALAKKFGASHVFNYRTDVTFKTSRTIQTESPVDSILAEKGAKHINANLLRYSSEVELQTPESNLFLQNGMKLAIRLADEDKVKPYIGKTINGTVEDINRELNELREGRGVSGKVAVKLGR
jgi:NADPH:quinone reductase-like Zn-dependent oxidoreductase